MADAEEETFDVVQVDSPHQRVIRRKRIFVAVPLTFAALVFLMVLWEILRQNIPAETLKHWPWRLELLNLEAGATVLTVLVVVVFTRTQYAEAVRPAIGWTLVPVRGGVDHSLAMHHIKDTKGLVIVNLFNGGGGGAVLVSIDYRVALATQADIPGWLSHPELHAALDRYGLLRGKDYYFDYLRGGLPLLPGESLFDRGLILALMERSAIRRLRILDIRLRFRDQVGDIHERVLDCRVVFTDEHDFDPRGDG